MGKSKRNKTYRHAEAVAGKPPKMDEAQAEAAMDAAALTVTKDDDGYDVIPTSRRNTAEGSYRFKVDGKKYQLPLLQYLDMDVALELTRGNNGGPLSDEQGMRMLFEKYAPKLLAELDPEQLVAVAARWRNASVLAGKSEVGLGE